MRNLFQGFVQLFLHGLGRGQGNGAKSKNKQHKRLDEQATKLHHATLPPEMEN
jgi:hypothetical protein